MKLEVILADPAKNITVLVKTPVPKEKRSSVSSAILSIDMIRAEQVGFITEPIFGGDIRLEMMGGEFCGNALRSVCLYASKLSGQNMIRGEISGYDGCLMSSISKSTGCVWANMPKPISITEEQFGSAKLPCVKFDGISHFIALNNAHVPRDRETFQRACTNLESPCVGLMLYDTKKDFLEPFVYVSATDSLFRENSCASGSAALTAFLDKNLLLNEPGGIIETRNKPLSIGGIVNLSKEFTIEI